MKNGKKLFCKTRLFFLAVCMAVIMGACFTVTASAADVLYNTTTTTKTAKKTISSKAKKTETKTSTTTKTYKKSGSKSYKNGSLKYTYKWGYTLKRVTTVKTKYTKGSKTTTVTTTVKDYYYTNMDSLTPSAPTKAHNAFNKLGFTLKFVPNASYTGYTDCGSRTVNLKTVCSSAYHELGHVVAFAAGNVDRSSEWAAIYNAEKSKYTDFDNNKAHVLSSAQEYFAQSFQDYCLRSSMLKSKRPQTYTFVKNAIIQCTDAQINRIYSLYRNFWGC